MMRVRWTVSCVLPGMASKPGAIAVTMTGVQIIPATQTTPTMSPSAFTTRFASRHAAV